MRRSCLYFLEIFICFYVLIELLKRKYQKKIYHANRWILHSVLNVGFSTTVIRNPVQLFNTMWINYFPRRTVRGTDNSTRTSAWISFKWWEGANIHADISPFNHLLGYPCGRPCRIIRATDSSTRVMNAWFRLTNVRCLQPRSTTTPLGFHQAWCRLLIGGIYCCQERLG